MREVDPAPRGCVRDDEEHHHQAVGSLARFLRADGVLVWVTLAPQSCGNGHPLGPGQVLVSSGPGLRPPSWRCRECGDVTNGEVPRP